LGESSSAPSTVPSTDNPAAPTMGRCQKRVRGEGGEGTSTTSSASSRSEKSTRGKVQALPILVPHPILGRRPVSIWQLGSELVED
jgi:hypothetical protein